MAINNFSFPCGCRITGGVYYPCPGAQVCLEVIAEVHGAMARRFAVDDLRAHLGGAEEIEEIVPLQKESEAENVLDKTH